MIHLESKVEIGVPGTVDVNIPADTSDYVDQVFRQFCEWFGGVNIDERTGGYVTKDGRLVKEPIVWVLSYCTTEQLEEYLPQVLLLAQRICEDLRQESVAVIVNCEMLLVSAA